MNGTTTITYDGHLFRVTIQGTSFSFSREELRAVIHDLQWGDLGNDPEFEKWLDEQALKAQKKADKQFIKSAVSDVKPFKHGEEGTHYACAEIANSDGPTTCCGCNNHKCK
jgi:hypothetical protein